MQLVVFHNPIAICVDDPQQVVQVSIWKVGHDGLTARVSTKDRMCCELAQTSFDECLASLDLILQGGHSLVPFWRQTEDDMYGW